MYYKSHSRIIIRSFGSTALPNII